MSCKKACVQLYICLSLHYNHKHTYRSALKSWTWKLTSSCLLVWNDIIHVTLLKQALSFAVLTFPSKQSSCENSSESHKTQQQQQRVRGHQPVPSAKQEEPAIWYRGADGGGRTEGLHILIYSKNMKTFVSVLIEDVHFHLQGGFLPNVFKVLAHRPAEFRAFFSYYNALMNKESGMTFYPCLMVTSRFFSEI